MQSREKDLFSLEILRSRLSHLPITGIDYRDATGSTNDDALSWVEQDAQDGCLVVADEQTAGRGRLDRTWVTRKGTSLAFSLIFKPEDYDQLTFYAPLGAIGVSMALEYMYALQPKIKWPNDVLVNGKKVCGILTEGCWQGERLAGVVLGIGINVASTAVRQEDEFRFPAGALENSLGKKINRLDLLVEVIQWIFEWRPNLGSTKFLEAWNQRLAFRGERVSINQPGQEILNGEILYIDQDGCLKVRQEDGIVISIAAGDVG